MYLFECIRIDGERRVEKGLSKIFYGEARIFINGFRRLNFNDWLTF